MRVEPFYRWLVPSIVSPVGQRLGRPLWTIARALEDLQWRSCEELQSRAMEQLRVLVDHAARHVPYYRQLFAEAGLNPRDLRSPADLGRVPISTKSDLRAGYPVDTTADNIPARYRQRMMTSGSTGLPFEFYWDRRVSAQLGGTYLFLLGWAGAAIWQTRVLIASPSYFYNEAAPRPWWRDMIGRLLIGERNESLSSDTLSLSALRALVQRVSARGSYFIRGYPRAVAGAAAELAEADIPLGANPRVVVTFAETLTPANAEVIQRGFGCPVVNYYSSWEVPQMAQTCPDNPQALHVNSERVIVRVVRADGSDAAPGETGRVVVTDLANFVMPFINYAPGDQAVAGGPCPCGRGMPVLSRLEGRDGEVIKTPQGREVSGVVLGQFLTFVAGIIPYVWEYQACQTAPAAVTLQVVPTSRFTPEVKSKLEHDLSAFLGSDVDVRVEPVDSIALEPSGKRVIIKPLP